MSHVVSRPPLASHRRRPTPDRCQTAGGHATITIDEMLPLGVTLECRAELNRADRSGSLLPKRRESLLAVAQSPTFTKKLHWGDVDY